MAEERALTEEAVLEALQGIRLPGEATGGLFAEIAAALALGVGLALLAGLVLRPLTRRRARPRPAPTITERVEAARRLPPEARQVALLRVLKETNPGRFAAFSQDLYRPGGLPAPERLEAEIARHG